MGREVRVVVGMILVAVLSVATGCNSDPIESDEPGNVLKQCCSEAQERVTTVQDVATDDFRKRCDACRRGNARNVCAASASKVNDTVKAAYGEFSMPMSCTSMKTKLKELGIE
jgi:hypothetical protein